MSLDYRNNDAVIDICQNNREKTVSVSRVNQAAAGLIGHDAASLLGLPLHKILPERIAELLDEYIEFESGGNDVGEVLSKVKSFSVLSADGKEKAFRIKVSQQQSDADHLFFSLILRDVAGERKNDAVFAIIRDNFKGHEVLDALTGLPDKATLVKNLDLLKNYSSLGSVSSCFAALQLDDYYAVLVEYGATTCNNILKHIASIACHNLRPDDVITSISNKQIGVLLVGIVPDAARMVLNRLRWQVAANPYIMPDKSVISISVSIGYVSINGDVGGSGLLDSVEKSLLKLPTDMHNTLLEV